MQLGTYIQSFKRYIYQKRFNKKQEGDPKKRNGYYKTGSFSIARKKISFDSINQRTALVISNLGSWLKVTWTWIIIGFKITSALNFNIDLIWNCETFAYIPIFHFKFNTYPDPQYYFLKTKYNNKYVPSRVISSVTHFKTFKILKINQNNTKQSTLSFRCFFKL